MNLRLLAKFESLPLVGEEQCRKERHEENKDMNDSELFQTSFRICVQCGYWSYSDARCYLDESELIPISDSQGDTRSPGTEMTSPSGIEFVWIPPGSFMMGSTEAQVDQALAECRRSYPECEREQFANETPQRAVTIDGGFWMGRYQVTQGQYESVMDGGNPSYFKFQREGGLLEKAGDYPVENLSWDYAKEFIMNLNSKNDGYVYSLPTEAEWEYAARAGTTTAFAFGNSLSSTQANFNGNYPYGNAAKGPYLERTTKVGSYRPNAWGLYDMHGNVWEWVEDIYQDSYTGLPTDGSANTKSGDSTVRVLRGGSWFPYGRFTRSAVRNWFDSSEWYNGAISSLGFRVVARAKSQ
jgi:formylglycine-generating enzyme required for sulfatase activity